MILYLKEISDRKDEEITSYEDEISELKIILKELTLKDKERDIVSTQNEKILENLRGQVVTKTSALTNSNNNNIRLQKENEDLKIENEDLKKELQELRLLKTKVDE